MACNEASIHLTQDQLETIKNAFGQEMADRLAELNFVSADSNSFIGVVLN